MALTICGLVEPPDNGDMPVRSPNLMNFPTLQPNEYTVVTLPNRAPQRNRGRVHIIDQETDRQGVLHNPEPVREWEKLFKE